MLQMVRCLWIAPAKLGTAVRLLFPVAILLSFLATPAAAQVPQPSRPGSLLPAPTAPRLPLPDLVITAVTVRDVEQPMPSAVARVTVANVGGSAANIPAMRVFLRGDAGGGMLSFRPFSPMSPETIPAGGNKTFSLEAQDICAAGGPGIATLRVDPDNLIAESDEANNVRPMSVPAAFAGGDLVAATLWLRPIGATGSAPVPVLLPGDLDVVVINPTPQPVLLCPGVTIWREVASPLALKRGLREVKILPGLPSLLRPGSSSTFTLSPAYQPGDLPPGPYIWKVQVNPYRAIRETNYDNDVGVGAAALK